MNTIAKLFFDNLPTLLSSFEALVKYAPAAMDTIKELKAFIERGIDNLQREGGMTAEEHDQLKAARDRMNDAAHWQPTDA